MKTYFLVVLFLAVLSSVGYGQLTQVGPVQNRQDVAAIKAKFSNTAGLIDLSKPEQAKRQIAANMQRTPGEFPGPGDHPVFLLHSSQEFARRGETVELTLVPMITSSERFQPYIQVLRPGYDGEYDGTERVGYSYSETGIFGELQGIQTLSPIKIYTKKFNPEDLFGRHTFNIPIYGEQGQLVQQILLDVFLVDAGQYGPWTFIHTAREVPNGIALTGNFPVGQPIYYLIGVFNYGMLITGPDPQYAAYASPNGKRVMLAGNPGFTRTVSVDVMMWSPNTRYAMVKPKAVYHLTE